MNGSRRNARWLVYVSTSLIGCGGSTNVGAPFARPQALVDCAERPNDLQARLWISGSDAPCLLVVDEAGATGRCAIAPGIERRVTIDWFVDRGGRLVVLAQAQRAVDLAGAQADVSVTFEDADYTTDSCKDMSVDTFNGADEIIVDGAARPACDLDGDGSSNIVEICAGGDPLGEGL